MQGKRCSESLIINTRRKDREGQSCDNGVGRHGPQYGHRLHLNPGPDSQHRHSGDEGHRRSRCGCGPNSLNDTIFSRINSSFLWEEHRNPGSCLHGSRRLAPWEEGSLYMEARKRCHCPHALRRAASVPVGDRDSLLCVGVTRVTICKLAWPLNRTRLFWARFSAEGSSDVRSQQLHK